MPWWDVVCPSANTVIWTAALTHATIITGTYVKEFVHSDFGRTVPNLGALLSNRQLDILTLDVLVSPHLCVYDSTGLLLDELNWPMFCAIVFVPANTVELVYKRLWYKNNQDKTNMIPTPKSQSLYSLHYNIIVVLSKLGELETCFSPILVSSLIYSQ